MQKLNSLTGLKILSIMCCKEMILMGGFNKNLLNIHKDIYLRPKVTLHCLFIYLFRIFVSDI